MEEEEYITYYQNPKVEILFGYFGGQPILTKQDQYKPLQAFEVDENGYETELKNFYEKKDDKASIQDIKKTIAGYATEAFKERGIIKKPAQVEVLLSFSIKENRFGKVDIDNLSKTVLDGLTGVAFEDDVQVTSLIVNKHIHPMKVDAIFIGVTELTDKQKGFGSEIKLFGPEKFE